MSKAGEETCRFECTKCGLCCTNRGEYAHVYLNDDEVRALAAYLGLAPRAFRRSYTFRDEYGWTQLKFDGDACVFLDAETNACGVYAVRPIQCATFPFWRDLLKDGEWTEEARALCEGVGRGRAWGADEVEARMRAFEQSEEN